MPSPSTSLATLRPDLAGCFMEFDLAMDRKGFIGHRVLPVFEAAKASGTFGRIPIEQLLQARETRRAPGAGYSRGDWTFIDESYACEEHGAEEPIDDREATIYAEYFDAELVSAGRAFDTVLRSAELRVAALLYNATTYTDQTTSITHEWDDVTNAVPINDVETAARAVWTRTGLWPNALILNRTVFRNLRLADQIIERIASSGAGSPTKSTDITVEMLKAVFDLEHILVAGSVKNIANEGQDASISSIWSNEYAMVTRIVESNDLHEPGTGRTFHYAEDGSQAGGTVETYRDETVRSDIVRARHDVHEKVIFTEVSQLLDNVTT